MNDVNDDSNTVLCLLCDEQLAFASSDSANVGVDPPNMPPKRKREDEEAAFEKTEREAADRLKRFTEGVRMQSRQNSIVTSMSSTLTGMWQYVTLRNTNFFAENAVWRDMLLTMHQSFLLQSIEATLASASDLPMLNSVHIAQYYWYVLAAGNVASASNTTLKQEVLQRLYTLQGMWVIPKVADSRAAPLIMESDDSVVLSTESINADLKQTGELDDNKPSWKKPILFNVKKAATEEERRKRLKMLAFKMGQSDFSRHVSSTRVTGVGQLASDNNEQSWCLAQDDGAPGVKSRWAPPCTGIARQAMTTRMWAHWRVQKYVEEEMQKRKPALIQETDDVYKGPQMEMIRVYVVRPFVRFAQNFIEQRKQVPEGETEESHRQNMIAEIHRVVELHEYRSHSIKLLAREGFRCVARNLLSGLEKNPTSLLPSTASTAYSAHASNPMRDVLVANALKGTKHVHVIMVTKSKTLSDSPVASTIVTKAFDDWQPACGVRKSDMAPIVQYSSHCVWPDAIGASHHRPESDDHWCPPSAFAIEQTSIDVPGVSHDDRTFRITRGNCKDVPLTHVKGTYRAQYPNKYALAAVLSGYQASDGETEPAFVARVYRKDVERLSRAHFMDCARKSSAKMLSASLAELKRTPRIKSLFEDAIIDPRTGPNTDIVNRDGVAQKPALKISALPADEQLKLPPLEVEDACKETVHGKPTVYSAVRLGVLGLQLEERLPIGSCAKIPSPGRMHVEANATAATILDARGTDLEHRYDSAFRGGPGESYYGLAWHVRLNSRGEDVIRGSDGQDIHFKGGADLGEKLYDLEEDIAEEAREHLEIQLRKQNIQITVTVIDSTQRPMEVARLAESDRTGATGNIGLAPYYGPWPRPRMRRIEWGGIQFRSVQPNKAVTDLAHQQYAEEAVRNRAAANERLWKNFLKESGMMMYGREAQQQANEQYEEYEGVERREDARMRQEAKQCLEEDLLRQIQSGDVAVTSSVVGSDATESVFAVLETDDRSDTNEKSIQTNARVTLAQVITASNGVQVAVTTSTPAQAQTDGGDSSEGSSATVQYTVHDPIGHRPVHHSADLPQAAASLLQHQRSADAFAAVVGGANDQGIFATELAVVTDILRQNAQLDPSDRDITSSDDPRLLDHPGLVDSVQIQLLQLREGLVQKYAAMTAASVPDENLASCAANDA